MRQCNHTVESIIVSVAETDLGWDIAGQLSAIMGECSKEVIADLVPEHIEIIVEWLDSFDTGLEALDSVAHDIATDIKPFI